MKFFDPNEIPKDKYKEVISSAIDYISLGLGSEKGKDFLEFFAEHSKEYSRLKEKLAIYELKSEQKDMILPAMDNLYRCANSSNENLSQICRAYDMDQGHLNESSYSAVKTITFGLISKKINENLVKKHSISIEKSPQPNCYIADTQSVTTKEKGAR
jgi:hypothetical protein